VADHFGIDRFGNAAVQQPSQTLKVVNKGGDQRIRRVCRQQTGNQLSDNGEATAEPDAQKGDRSG
jgi:hypothetical protein